MTSPFGDCIGLGPGSITTCPSFPDALADPFKRTSGFADMVYVGLVSAKKVTKIKSTGATVIWGLGPTVMFPTAADEVLGYGKYGLGPSGVVAYLGSNGLGISRMIRWARCLWRSRSRPTIRSFILTTSPEAAGTSASTSFL